MSIPASATVDSPQAAQELSLVSRPTSRVWVRLRSHPSALVGFAILAVYVLATVFGPMVFRYDPIQNHLSDAFLPSSLAHPLGTDEYGRDELARLLFGTRYTLALGFAAVAIGLVVGVPLGAVSGYFGGWVDLGAQRVTDVLLAFPNILLALALVAAPRVGLQNVLLSV